MTETLVYQVVLDAANGINNARAFRSSLEDIERAAKPSMFSGFGGAATTAFNAVKSGAGAALTAILALTGPIATVTAGLTAMTAVGSSAQWEKQMAGVFKTTDLDRGTAAAVQMNDELLDLYANMRGVGKEGITSVAQGLGSLGIANAEIKDTTKTVLEASAAFGMLPEQSMDALATITNLWKGQTQEMGGVANMMQHIGSATNELGNKSKATEPNVLSFLAAVGGYATMYGETAEDTAALGALFESVGVNAADAETAMRSALQAGLFQSHKPAEDIAQLLGMPLNKSGKAESVMGYDVAANILGIDKAEIRQRMETDLYGTMVDVASALKSRGLSETQQTQVAELIFGGYASAHWLKLAGQGEELDRLTSISREGYQSGTSMSQEYQRQTDNLIDTLGEFKNTLDVAAITAFTAALEPAKDKIAEMAQWVRDAIPTVEEFFNALWSGDWGKADAALGGISERIKSLLQDVGQGAGIALIGAGFTALVPVVLGAMTTLSTGTIAKFVSMKAAALGNAATMAAGTIVSYAGMAATSAGSLVTMTARVSAQFLLQKSLALRGAAAMAGGVVGSFGMMAASSMASLGGLMARNATMWGQAVTRSLTSAGTMALGVVGHYATMALAAASSMATIVGTTVGGFASMVAAVAAPVALIVVGLAAIGYSLNPGKFTTFNKVASDAFNGIKDVVLDVWDLIQKGDLQGVANRLKQAFGDGINFVKGLPWKDLGNEVVTMASDGAKATIDGAFKLGDWIHDQATNWISAGGPRQLGQDIAGATGAGIQWVINTAWDFFSSEGGLDQAFGTVTEWLSIGWGIAKGVGEGIFQKIYENVQPVANEILTQFIKAVLGISAEFAKGWNTILIGAAKAAEGIINVFNNVGEKVAKQLDPVLTKLNEIGNVISRNSGASPLSYYDKESGARYTPEQYAALPADRKKGVHGVYANASYAPPGGYSQTYAGAQPIAGTTNQLVGTSIVDASGQKVAHANSLGAGTDWSILSPMQALLNGVNWAGYRTGGQGFVSSELQGAGSGKVRMITDKGDLVTLTGMETMGAAWFDIIAPYTADYITNTDQSAKAIADHWIPAAKKSGNNLEEGGKSASDSMKAGARTGADTTVSGTSQAVDILKDGIFDTTAGVAQTLAQASQTVSQQLAAGSQAGARALQLGSEVAAKIHSDGVANAVTLYQGANGQVCAAIGSVGQKFQADGTAVSGALNLSSQNLQSTSQAVNQATLSTSQTINAQKVNAQNQANTLQLSGINQSGAAWKSNITASGSGFKTDASAAGDTIISKTDTAMGNFATGVGTVTGLMTQAFKGMQFSYRGFPSTYGDGSSIGSVGTANQTFNDCFFEGFVDQCTNMPINGLKYTNPGGQTYYINPMTYHSTGGISDYIGRSSSSSPLPSVFNTNNPWAAKGADVTEHQLIHVAEKGPELILPPKIRNTILRLTDMGFGSIEGGNQATIEPADIYLDCQKVGQIVFKVGTSRIRRKGLSVK